MLGHLYIIKKLGTLKSESFLFVWPRRPFDLLHRMNNTIWTTYVNYKFNSKLSPSNCNKFACKKKKPGWLNLHEQIHLNQKDDSDFAVKSFWIIKDSIFTSKHQNRKFVWNWMETCTQFPGSKPLNIFAKKFIIDV